MARCRRCKAKTEGRYEFVCSACRVTESAQHKRKRGWCGQCAGDHSTCLDCRKVRAELQRAIAEKCMTTKRESSPHMLVPVSAEKYWQRKAHSMVRAAVKRGVLPDLANAEVACADCGDAAAVYEHRDYARPLDVVPACHACNHKRGTAKWPMPGDFVFVRRKMAEAGRVA